MSGTSSTLGTGWHDRALGAVLGGAYGDALGAGYEFGGPVDRDTPVEMIGGGLGRFAPGEWTDDTSMAVSILRALADGLDLRTDDGLTAVSAGFVSWFESEPPDIGIQTRKVLARCDGQGHRAMVSASQAVFADAPEHSAGNGSLMRTGPVALGYLSDSHALAQAARAVSALTHADPTCGEACLLWSEAIRTAIVTGGFTGWSEVLSEIQVGRAGYWRDLLAQAESQEPESFAAKDGWVVAALQHSWSAIVHTLDPDPARHVRRALERVIRAGNDTDTVACITGALLGARYGVGAFDSIGLDMLHGWPGLRRDDLTGLVSRAVER